MQQYDQVRKRAIDKKGMSWSYIISLQLSRQVIPSVKNIAAASCPAAVLPVITRPKARTGKDSFATLLKDVPLPYPFIQLSPIDLYDYSTSAGVTTPLQTCLFNSARE